jgi:hypothetical protein
MSLYGLLLVFHIYEKEMISPREEITSGDWLRDERITSSITTRVRIKFP